MRLPQQLQRAMAAEAEASREARAKVKLFYSESLTRKPNGLFGHHAQALLLKI